MSGTATLEQSRRSQKGRSGRTNYNVSAEQFVDTWQNSDSADEVSEKLGMPKPIVYARASEYRGDGISLKVMSRVRGLDVDALNRRIEALQKKHGQKPTRVTPKVRKKAEPSVQRSFAVVAGVVGSLGSRARKAK